MDKVSALRMQRHGLLSKVQETEFPKLFGLLSPVRPVSWSCPGSPPELRYRTEFDNGAFCAQLRQEHKLLKGRFQGGCIAYVLAKDFPLFAALYRDSKPLSHTEQEMLMLFKREGPMNIGLVREITGLRAKDITPVLHRLQRKFLLLEDQSDSEWDRPWMAMEEFCPELWEQMPSAEDAVCEILLRFVHVNVRVNPEMAHAFYQLPPKLLKEGFSRLEEEGKLLHTELGWILPEDEVFLQEETPTVRSVFALQRNDPLVLALIPEFTVPEYQTLQYLLIDAEFHGAVVGKFRQGPFDVEDILLDLPPDEWEARRTEILKAVQAENPGSQIKQFCGKAL